MKEKGFKIGDIVQFGTIKTKVVKSDYATGGCSRCVLNTLCDLIYQDVVPVNAEKVFNKMIGNCSGIDVDGKSINVCFEEIVETKDE